MDRINRLDIKTVPQKIIRIIFSYHYWLRKRSSIINVTKTKKEWQSITHQRQHISVTSLPSRKTQGNLSWFHKSPNPTHLLIVPLYPSYCTFFPNRNEQKQFAQSISSTPYEHILYGKLCPKLLHPQRTINKERGRHNKNSRSHHLATSPCSDFITIKNWKP